MLNPRYLTLDELVKYTLDNPDQAGSWACALARLVGDMQSEIDSLKLELASAERELSNYLMRSDDDHR